VRIALHDIDHKHRGQATAVKCNIDRVKTVWIATYILQRVDLLQLPIETQFPSGRIRASHIPGHTLVDALLLGIKRVDMQLVAANVAGKGAIQMDSVVVPGDTRLRMTLGPAG